MYRCTNCGADTLRQLHKPNCPQKDQRQIQTNQKCREFGMKPYYQPAT